MSIISINYVNILQFTKPSYHMNIRHRNVYMYMWVDPVNNLTTSMVAALLKENCHTAVPKINTVHKTDSLHFLH